MKGFIPVTKASLLEMLENCRYAVEEQYNCKFSAVVNNYIESEKKRITTRKWYRLWMLPKPAFNFNEKSVISYAETYPYALFEVNPFKMLDDSFDEAMNWIDDKEEMFSSIHAGEPIQIEIKMFERLNTPMRFKWVSTNLCFNLNNYM